MSRTHTSTINTTHAKLGQPRMVPVPCTTMDTCSTPTDGSGARQGQHAKAKPVALIPCFGSEQLLVSAPCARVPGLPPTAATSPTCCVPARELV